MLILRSSVAAPGARTSRRTAAALLAVALAGCGQKGPLMLPASGILPAVPEATRPVEQPAPPPAEPAGGASAPVR